MKVRQIKQQKQIRLFLVEEFGEHAGKALFKKQTQALDKLINDTKNKSKNQMKTLTQTILPRIALYQVLAKEDLSEEHIYSYMRTYMLEIVARQKHSTMIKMELTPGFYWLYSTIALKIMRKSDLHESKLNHGRDFFDFTITKCLWHTACVENSCANLFPLFCDVDNVTYGNLKKLGFSRTKTLGYGGDCCDFHFFRK